MPVPPPVLVEILARRNAATYVVNIAHLLGT
jgi:hypothetical protein